MKVLALIGKGRVGKDTVACMLETHLTAAGLRVAQEKVAGPLKQCLAALFGLDHEELEGFKKELPCPEKLPDGVTPRQLMQFFGTEILQFELQRLMPSLGREVHARALVRRMDALRREGTTDVCIVTDVRFPHELVHLRSFQCRPGGGDPGDVLAVRVIAGEASVVSTLATATTGAHSSEFGVPLLRADVELRNDGTLQELQASTEALLVPWALRGLVGRG